MTSSRKPLPCGTWPSDITAHDAAAVIEGSWGGLMFEPRSDGEHLYFLSSRTDEGGRNAIYRWVPGEEAEMILPLPWNARSRVHEYGGAAYVAHQGTVYFSNDEDARIYRLIPGGSPEPITAQGPWRFADFTIDSKRNRLVGIREDHTGVGEDVAEERNELVAVDLNDGSMVVLFGEADFVSAPRISPSGDEIAWLAWDHPNLPWDDVALYRAHIGEAGDLFDIRTEASMEPQARMQPLFSPDGELFYLSDADNWWNLYRWPADRASGQQVTHLEAEIGFPQWYLGRRDYDFLNKDESVVVYTSGGSWHAASVSLASGQVIQKSHPWAMIGGMARHKSDFYLQAGDERGNSGFFTYDSGSLTFSMSLKAPTSIPTISVAQAFEVPVPVGQSGADTELTHAFYYPPTHDEFRPLADERPPVIVTFHGGPTAQSFSNFAIKRQFWTSRGFAILDVNYRGSTGYGREYRQKLYGKWGEVDVEDAVAVLRYAAEKGLVDIERSAIMGGSAGGFTTLAALAFHDAFAAGTNLFGVSQLVTFVRDTHKFESRYMEHLIGKWPQDQEVYEARSPALSADQIKVPLLTLQGADDKVVPPSQSHVVVEALRKQGVPTAYIEFEGEQHGFRKKENLARALEAELSFYGQIFGFEPAGDITPIEIENLKN